MQLHEPASSIVELFNGVGGEPDGVKVVAAALSAPASRVRNWRRAKGANGTGGIIPHWYMSQLLQFAALHNIDLQPGDFATVLRLQAKKAEQQVDA